jgi:hypothetical protein
MGEFPMRRSELNPFRGLDCSNPHNTPMSRYFLINQTLAHLRVAPPPPRLIEATFRRQSIKDGRRLMASQ